MEAAELVEALAENARRVEALFAGVSEEDARRAPGPGLWSAAQVLDHMRAAEAIMFGRVPQILVRPGLHLPDMDERRWGDVLARADLSVRERVAAFASRRREVVGLLRALTPEEWALAGAHELGEKLTIRRIASHGASHEREHLDQIEAALRG